MNSPQNPSQGKSDFLSTFSNELNQIKDSVFRSNVESIINICPDYILRIPSSSTGKYHPTDEIKEDGMIRHVKRMVVFVDEISRMEQLSDWERDILVAGCLLHDIFKNGKTLENSKYTIKEHPILIYQTIYDYIKEYIKDIKETSENQEQVKMLISLANVCLWHEGQWTIEESRQEWNKRNIEKRMSDNDIALCKLFHSVDYFASRRSIFECMQPAYFGDKGINIV